LKQASRGAARRTGSCALGWLFKGLTQQAFSLKLASVRDERWPNNPDPSAIRPAEPGFQSVIQPCGSTTFSCRGYKPMRRQQR